MEEPIRSEILEQDIAVAPFKPNIDKKIRDIPMNRFYLLAREVLLQSQEGVNHKPQCEYSCDRRYTYLRCREAILAHKYPHRDKTDFEQQLSLRSVVFCNSLASVKQFPKENDIRQQLDDFMFYDIGAQEEIDFLAQPLGLMKKKKKTAESKLAQEEFESTGASPITERPDLTYSNATVHSIDNSLDPAQMIKFKLAPSEQKVNVVKEEKKNHLLEKELQKTFALKDQVLNTPPLSKSTDELNEKAIAYTPDENSFSFRGRSGYNSEVSERDDESSREGSREESGKTPEFSKKEKKLAEGEVGFNFDEKFVKFTHNKRAVTRIKFGVNSPSLLAFSSVDKTLTVVDICDYKTLNTKPNILKDFDWSMMNDFILTCSIDNTLRVWDIRTGKCIRTITHVSPLLACLFHPINNNVMITSTGGGYLGFYNFSTGKEIMSLFVGETRQVKSMTFSDSGQMLYAGCTNGDIVWYECTNPGMFTQFQFKGELSSLHKRPINSLCFRDYHSTGETKIPSLLVNPTNSTITLYKIGEKNQLTHWMVCPIINKSYTVRSCFAPLLRSNRYKASVMSGSEDGIIYFYSYTPIDADITGFNNVLSLKVHTSPVLDIAWNYDETFFASADASGMVIVWTRDDKDTFDID